MAAKKGNKTALGNDGGRPPFYTTAIELQNKIDEYFNNCPETKAIAISESVINVPVYTISGLAYYLGFESRQSLYDYENNEVFSYIIKRAKLRIEMKYEQNLSFQNATGSIFALKNMGWKDKTEHELSGSVALPITGIKILTDGANT